MCVRAPYAEIFRESKIVGYDDVLDLSGELLREQPRTTLRRIEIRAPGGAGSLRCVLKVYRYPHVTGARTWGAISKAEREYGALIRCASLGAPAAEPVAWGRQRNGLGFVSSCFIVTEYLEGCRTLWDWLPNETPLTADGSAIVSDLLRGCGELLRKAHAERFFLFTLSAKNILLGTGEVDAANWRFLDLPYARTIQTPPVARWAQQRDFGALAGPIHRFAGDKAFEAFYETYLPDPLGESEGTIREAVRRGALVFNKQTPFTRAVKRLKSAFRSVRT